MAIVIIIILVLIVVVAVSINNDERKKLEALRLRYEQSLKGTNKRDALQAGRAYYSALNNGKMLTIYDEQAITNDLSTMDQTSDLSS